MTMNQQNPTDRRRLAMLYRRADHLTKRVAGRTGDTGGSFDRRELDALHWAIGIVESTAINRSMTWHEQLTDGAVAS